MAVMTFCIHTFNVSPSEKEVTVKSQEHSHRDITADSKDHVKIVEK